MAIHPFFPGSAPSGTSADDLITGMPEREVFVKDTDGSMMGTGMRLLPDGKLLAPDGFSVESGSIDFGDVITVSESAGFLGIRNNLNSEMYQVVDYHIPRDAASDNPRIFQLTEAEWMFTPQTDVSSTLTANPLIFNYTTTLDARTNSITFKSAIAMSNVRIKITKSDVNVAIKYLPTKSSWSIGTGGYSFVVGDNIIDFKDSPVPLSIGTMLTFEIRATSISLKGNSSGIPYFGVMTQRGVYQDIPLSVEVNPSAIRDKLESLSSPDKLAKTAIQDAVLSVNGQFGDVTVSVPAGQIQSDWSQAGTSALDYIKNKPTIPTNTNQLTNGNGFITSSGAPVQSVNGQTGTVVLTIPAAQVNTDWNSSSGISQLLNKPSLAAVALSGSYADLTNKPTIPSAQVSSDWTSVSGVSQILNKPTLFSGAYADLTGKPTTFPPSAHTHVIADVTGLQTALDGKFATPVGTALQYVRGNGTLATLPTAVSTFTNDSGYLTTITSGQVTTALGFTPYNSTNPSAYINQAGARTAISLTTTGTSGASTYNNSTGVLNVPVYTPASPVQSSATRTLNTAFQISTTRNSLVMYSVQITVSASITGGQNGDVVLEIASDSGFTTNVQTVAVSGLGQTYTLAIALAGVQPQTTVVSGFVPVGYYARLRTVNNTGTPGFAYRFGQEVLL